MRSVKVRLAMIIALSMCDRVFAAVLWTENAENGYANIIDNSDASYALIQSDIAGQGNSAFHLANPGFQDNWFELDQTLTIEADTKLFMLSRLTYATPSQVAKVQISTNGGATWPTTIYSQAGTNGPGEGAFGLKQVDLSAYANQSLRFRFYYDFTGGSAFTQADSGVGWYVDDIQIADQLQKSLYSIGNPSAHEQLYLEYINRARADALVEAARLANETDPDITSAYGFFGINTANIVDQFQWYVANGHIDQTSQPLSFSAALNVAADLHTQDMFNNQFQGHSSSSTPPSPLVPFGSLTTRLNTVEYNYVGAGENVFSFADSVAQGHAGFDVDWGNTSSPGHPAYNPAFVGQGMQNPGGHRMSIHNGDFKEIGVGVINGTNGTVGPQLVTQDFGNPGDATFITGVVFEDLNNNSFYDLGEGRSGVRVDVEGSAYYAISSDSGGYSVPVTGDGMFDVLFSGGGFPDFSSVANIVNGWNYKVDYLTSAVSYAADFDNDGDVDVMDLSRWQSAYGINANADADSDGDSDGFDMLVWQREYGSGLGELTAAQSAIPEPDCSMLILITALFTTGSARTGGARCLIDSSTTS